MAKQHLTDEQKEAKKRYNRQWNARNQDKKRASIRRWVEHNRTAIRERGWSRGGMIGDGLYALFLGRLEKQNKACAICGKAIGESSRGSHFDHDHITGAPRGVLFRDCNIGIGMFGDSIDVMRNAIEYINKWRSIIEGEEQES